MKKVTIGFLFMILLTSAICYAGAPTTCDVTLGAYSTHSDLRNAIKKYKENRIGEEVSNIFEKIPLVKTKKEAYLIWLTVGEDEIDGLGFKHGDTYKKIVARAKKIRLELCPPEVGPLLMIRERNPGEGKGIIAMRPIVASNGKPAIFAINEDEKHCSLHLVDGDPNKFWNSNTRFVFRSFQP